MRFPRRRPQRRALLVLVPSAVLALVLAGSVGTWLLTRDGSAAVSPATTATVTEQTLQQTVAASGTLVARNTADLDFAVDGTVTSVLVGVGDRVRVGDVLARVGDATLLASRRAAAAALTAAVAQLDDDLDADASAIQVAADRAAVVSARAALRAARTDVGDATLRATIAGTVTAVGVEVGDVVGSGSTTSGSGSASSASSDATSSTTDAAVEIVSVGHVVLDATVAAADAAALAEGQSAEVTVSGADQPVAATVTDVGLVAQANSSGAAVFPVTLRIAGEHDDLYSGTSAEASIVTSERAGVLTVDTRALQSDDAGTYVDLLVDGEPVRTAVTVGETLGSTTEITAGLSAGQTVQVPGTSGFGGFGGQEGGAGGGQAGLPEGPGGGQEGFPAPSGGFSGAGR